MSPCVITPKRKSGNASAKIRLDHIFTTDETQARQMAARLECGGVFINGYCASDARVAFGGVKKSGFGRELSHFGLHEFCNIQTVWKDRI